MVREVVAKNRKRCKNRGGAFGITILDHATIEDLGWVENFEPRTPSGTFVAAEATVIILHDQKRIDAIEETGIRNHFWETAV